MIPYSEQEKDRKKKKKERKNEKKRPKVPLCHTNEMTRNHKLRKRKLGWKDRDETVH
jgi:hypothetical protein